MAGIGFVLRHLMQQNNLSGVVRAYMNAIIISSGYWLATVAAIAVFHFFAIHYFGFTETFNEFRSIIFYNFAFSLILSAPVFIVATRFLSEAVYRNNFTEISGMLIGSLVLILAISFPFAIIFYIFYAKVSSVIALLAIANFILVSCIWLAFVFLTSLKYYTTVTLSILFGTIGIIGFGVYLNGIFGEKGLLFGFNIGASMLLAGLLSSILATFPSPIVQPFLILKYLRHYWEIALGGLFYNLAIWIDKFIMLAAPEAERLNDRLWTYPDYDTVMFLAYLTVIPAMASFVLTQETAFFEHYLKFYRGILNHNIFTKIESNCKSLLHEMNQLLLDASLSQIIICLLTLLIAPTLLHFFSIPIANINIFRYSVIGATFQIITLFMIIFLSYYDYRRGAMWIQLFFLISNALLTYLSLQYGFFFYGLGYCLSTIFTFIFAGIILERYTNRLTYHTFVTQNTAISETTK